MTKTSETDNLMELTEMTELMDLPKLPVCNVQRRNLLHTMNQLFQTVDTVILSAHAGWGKTVAAVQFVRQYRRPSRWIRIPEQSTDWNRLSLSFRSVLLDMRPMSLLVLDDYQNLPFRFHERLGQMAADRQIKLLILSRSKLPPALKQESGITLGLISTDQLRFSREEILEMLELYGVKERRNAILTATVYYNGWPFAWHLLLTTLRDEKRPFEENMLEQAEQAAFCYFDRTFFVKWSDREKYFLLSAGCYETLTLQQMKEISEIQDCTELITDFLCSGQFYTESVTGSYHMQHFFLKYLQQKQKETLSANQVYRICSRAALTFESSGQIMQALDSWSRVDGGQQQAQILTRLCKKEMRLFEIWKYRTYLRHLPEDITVQSPYLCWGCAIVEMLSCNPDAALQRADQMLQAMQDIPEKTEEFSDAAYQYAFLRTVLVQSGKKDFKTAILEAWQDIDRSRLQKMKGSLTAGRPSIYNGLLDLSQYGSSISEFLTQMQFVTETLYGDLGQACLDICRAEQLYLSDTPDEAMRLVSRWIPVIKREKRVDLLFAAQYLQIRLLMTQGEIRRAYQMAPLLTELAKEDDAQYILNNIHAALAWVALHEGKSEEVNAWLELGAPDENEEFCLLNGYAYLVKMHCYLESGRHLELIALGETIRDSVSLMNRPMDECRMETLLAMSYGAQHMQEEAFSHLERAVSLAEKYAFPRLLEDEGTAMQELLQAYMKRHQKTAFLTKIAERARLKGSYFQGYLMTNPARTIFLTATERKVLSLLSAGYTNDEICEELGIKRNTVKTHLKNIFNKMQVSNRTEAAHLAQERHLL